jgi:hypothetical protein
MAKKLYTKKTYETIDSIVRGVCMDLDEGLERYEQYLHWALQAHKDWHLDRAKEIKTVRLALTSYKAIELPEDFVDWTKVGIECGNTILTFTHDEDCPSFDVNDYSILDSGQVGQSFGYYYYNFINSKGQDTGKLFGLSAKDNYQGYFRLNRERAELQFRSKITNLQTIYLEYISNGYDPCGESFVNPMASNLIRLYVHWQRLKFSKNSARWQVADAKQEYVEELDLVGWRMFDLTTEDILESWREGFSLLPMN